MPKTVEVVGLTIGDVFKQYLIEEFNAPPEVADTAREFVDSHPAIAEIVPQDGWFAVHFDPDAKWGDVVKVFEDLAAYNPCLPPEPHNEPWECKYCPFRDLCEKQAIKELPL